MEAEIKRALFEMLSRYDTAHLLLLRRDEVSDFKVGGSGKQIKFNTNEFWYFGNAIQLRAYVYQEDILDNETMVGVY